MLPKTKSAFFGLSFLLLNFGPPAQAQKAPPAPPSALAPTLALRSFAVAYDSLLHRVARTRAQAEARTSSFKATQGSLGGLHRKVWNYAGVPQNAVNAVGVETSPAPGVVRQQTVRHRYGIELEKVVYRDIKGRKVLTERYEDHRLTRLELFEYQEPFNTPVSGWLLVQGDYLRYTSTPIFTANKSPSQTSYFFRSRPACG